VTGTEFAYTLPAVCTWYRWRC